MFLEEVINDSSTNPSSSSENSDMDTDDDREPNHLLKEQSGRLLYHASMALKETIEVKCKTTPKMARPPTSQDLNLDTALNMTPTELYNVIAWTTAMTTEFPAGMSVRVSVGEEENQNILSLCQDMMNLATRGWLLMVKHCTLAMTIRHPTGSAQLIGILNGLGHCSSNSQVLEHDTALAELQMQRGSTYIPSSITAQLPATLVWDNNDFGEKTVRKGNHA